VLALRYVGHGAGSEGKDPIRTPSSPGVVAEEKASARNVTGM
jgi:hypothetical protein